MRISGTCSLRPDFNFTKPKYGLELLLNSLSIFFLRSLSTQNPSSVTNYCQLLQQSVINAMWSETFWIFSELHNFFMSKSSDSPRRWICQQSLELSALHVDLAFRISMRVTTQLQTNQAQLSSDNRIWHVEWLCLAVTERISERLVCSSHVRSVART